MLFSTGGRDDCFSVSLRHSQGKGCVQGKPLRVLHRCGITVPGPEQGRQSCRCLESGSLHPPQAALHRFPCPISINPPQQPIFACGKNGKAPKKKDTPNGVSFFFGAGNEARTRYLHLGKVALYQMSYARGTRCILTDESHLVKHFHQFSSLSFSSVSVVSSSTAPSGCSASSGSSGCAAAKAASSSSVGSSRNSTRPTGPSAG